MDVRCPPDDSEPPVEQIVIPMQPVQSAELHGGVPEVIETATGPRLTMDARVNLAQGDGYPSDFTATFASPLWANCGRLKGPVTLTQLTGVGDAPGSDEPAVSVALDGSDAIAFSAHSPGHRVLVGEGTVALTDDVCGLSAGTTLPFDLELTVTVIAANAARIQLPCDSEGSGNIEVAPASHSSALSWSGWFSPTLVDETGTSIVVDNAERDAQVTVRLYGMFDPAHASPRRLSEWITPSRTGAVDIVPAFGDTTTVDVVPLSRITSVGIEFQLAGVAGGATTLESGEVYGDKGWARTGNRVAPMVQELRTDRGALCSAPSPTWLSLDTLTPEVCEIVDLLPPAVPPAVPPEESLESFLLFGDRIGHAARLKQAGTCSLVVRAPELPASVSLPSLDASFGDPSGLLEPQRAA